MTKPTQAQIEAAARAIFDKFKFLSGDRDKWENAKQETYREFAKAALIAAAEVGGTVEVGNVADSYKMAMRREIAATIERCAQVAKDFLYEHYGSSFDAIAENLVAAIIALKNKP